MNPNSDNNPNPNAGTPPNDGNKRKGPRPVDPSDFGVERERPDPAVWPYLALAKRGKGEDAPFVAQNTPMNLHLILTGDHRLVGGIRLNEFDGSTMLRVPGESTLEPVNGTNVTKLVIWLEIVYGMRTTEERVGKSLNEAAAHDPYHPIRDYFQGIRWDGTPRVSGLLSRYMGAADSTLHQHLSRCWMISAVARVMRPGCKVDTTLILVGKQGARKSTAIRVLAGDYSADTLLDLGSKDLYEAIHGVWIYELAELDSFRKAEWPKIKAILSSPRDRYRRPYAPAAEPRDRQCIFVGTTNDDHFLGDPTGSRRFWPVRIGDRVDIRALQQDRDQLWAEAAHLYSAGVRWWLDDEQSAALARAAEDFTQRHPWYDKLDGWAAMQTGQVSMAEVLEKGVGKDPGQWHQGDAKIAGEIMREIGWETCRVKENGSKVRRWRRGSE